VKPRLAGDVAARSKAARVSAVATPKRVALQEFPMRMPAQLAQHGTRAMELGAESASPASSRVPAINSKSDAHPTIVRANRADNADQEKAAGAWPEVLSRGRNAAGRGFSPQIPQKCAGTPNGARRRRGQLRPPSILRQIAAEVTSAGAAAE